MITRQLYPLFIAGYHLSLVLVSLVILWAVTKMLGLAGRRSRLNYGVSLLTINEAIALIPMVGYVRANVSIRDESINFLVFNSVVVFLLFLISSVASANCGEHRRLIYIINFTALLCVAVAWISN